MIIDLRPDVVINIGDAADMPSLSGYDKGRRSFQGRTYKADVDAHLEFQDRLWGPVRKTKKRLPYRVFLEGNHEQRITRAIDMQPELEGAISFDDLRIGDYYDDIIRYEGSTPGVVQVDGIHYAHYFISGLMGRPVGGEHPATSLIAKQYVSCTAGHSHLADWSVRSDPTGRKIMGCICGVYQDYDADWAGESNRLWYRGLVFKRNVSEGQYSPQFISLAELKAEYGS